ncbi:ribosomal L7Ae/L30e/S12e/Gadd45 family protein [Oscillospiraceae bacterium OttesenSCG-928-G22]|nr:ribosomal L7Ae/L30e/S12e/Gadd45 family protein [Oscillospiraceae bacterium OttesenSCG-928-G22]
MEELKTGKKAVGLKQSKRAVLEGAVVRAYIAADAQERVTAPFLELLAEKGIPHETVPSMLELGKAAGIDVKAAVAVLLRG